MVNRIEHEVKFGSIGGTVAAKYIGVSIHMECKIIIKGNRDNIDMEDIRMILESGKYRLLGNFCRGIDEEVLEMKEKFG